MWAIFNRYRSYELHKLEDSSFEEKQKEEPQLQQEEQQQTLEPMHLPVVRYLVASISL
jgi:hypothetical protein